MFRGIQEAVEGGRLIPSFSGIQTFRGGGANIQEEEKNIGTHILKLPGRFSQLF